MNREPHINEVWKNISGYDDLYQISNKGNVKSLYTGKILKSCNGKYKTVCLCKNKKKKTHTIHRLVAREFLPNYDSKETINHKDGDVTNNNVENLEWNTYGENIKHSFKVLGRKISGCSKVCVENSKRVGLVVNGEITRQRDNIRKASIDMGVSETPIFYVCNGKQKSTKGMVFKYI